MSKFAHGPADPIRVKPSIFVILSLCYSVQLDFDFDYTAMPRIGRRGNSGCDSDGMAVCKH